MKEFERELVGNIKGAVSKRYCKLYALPTKTFVAKHFSENATPIMLMSDNNKVLGALTYEYYLELIVPKTNGDVNYLSVNSNDLVSLKAVTNLSLDNLNLNVDPGEIETIICIYNSQGIFLGWIQKEDLFAVMFDTYKKYYKLSLAIMDSLPCGVVCTNETDQTVYYRNKTIDENNAGIDGMLDVKQKSPLIINNKVAGEVALFHRIKDIEEIIKGTDVYQDLLMDMKVIFDNSWDVIYVSDSKGVTLRVSKACELFWGMKPEELVGKTVYDLEKSGVFVPSITKMVLESKERVTALQKTITGKHLMVVGIPIKDSEGNIVRVINTSRDITEQENLQMEIDRLREISDRYKQELLNIQKGKIKDLVYRSKEMGHCVELAKKAAQVDSTVLITGETGVGKEVVASAIHDYGNRKNGPFITINCASIPDNLLESELFGYKSGAFTGAEKGGKAGLVELSDGGTLFLDEIGEIPQSLQAKLLRVIQEKKVHRIGGTQPITVNMRVIASTNRDLEEEVHNKRFREDLFYRLNVIPIHIPPLRQRKDDILPLLVYFLKRYNVQYLCNKTLTNDALDSLINYVNASLI